MFLVAAIPILAGLCVFFFKYRIVIGSTRYQADIVQEYLVGGPRSTLYGYIVRFRHEGESIEKPVMNQRISPYPKLYTNGGSFLVYYNPKYPKVVVRRSFGIDLLALFAIGLGIVLVLN